MEKIYYIKEQIIKEEHEFVIEDMKNVFLKGREPIGNRTVYLGIWQNQNAAGVTAIIGDREIKFDYSRYGLSGSTVSIKKFLENNRRIEKITKEVFFSKLNNLKDILSAS